MEGTDVPKYQSHDVSKCFAGHNDSGNNTATRYQPFKTGYAEPGVITSLPR
ncbi:MAG: hypothetical protein IKW74_00755 [Thermoguttaceae bacterium]|nr:hypothetical protein [Thermoguttaceae bacterium]